MVPQSSGNLARSGGSGTLYDVLELILDRGLVIDVFIRVSLVGIEILKIDIRIVVASVDTYLRFAEAANRLDLSAQQGKGLPDVTGGAKGAIAGKAGQKMIANAGDRLLDKAGDVLERIGQPERSRDGD